MMKKILLVAAVTGAIVFAGCKKDNVTPMKNSWNKSQNASGDSTIFPNDSIDFPQDSIWYPADSLNDYYPLEDSSWVINDSIDG
jgi:hypothetical protein